MKIIIIGPRLSAQSLRSPADEAGSLGISIPVTGLAFTDTVSLLVPVYTETRANSILPDKGLCYLRLCIILMLSNKHKLLMSPPSLDYILDKFLIYNFQFLNNF